MKLESIIRVVGEPTTETHTCVGDNSCLTCFMNYRGWSYHPAEIPHWSFTKPDHQSPSYVMTMRQAKDWLWDIKKTSLDKRGFKRVTVSQLLNLTPEDEQTVEDLLKEDQ